jgi:hypothetical protein
MRGGHSSMTSCLVGNDCGCRGDIRCICCIVTLEKPEGYHFVFHRLHSVGCLVSGAVAAVSKARLEPIKSLETVARVKHGFRFLP